jgi:hypothetical protein
LENCYKVLLIDYFTLNTDIFLDDTCYINNFLHQSLIKFHKIGDIREYIMSSDSLKDEYQILLLNPFTVLTGIHLDNSSHVFE